MTKIFISYRRSDTASITGRIYDRLVLKFKRENIFKDVDDIPAGVNFASYIQDSLRRSAVMLLIIGRKWLSAQTPDGARRLDDPTDWVRIEIETALSLGLTIFPLLVEGATMPTAANLPESLREVPLINGLQVRDDPDFVHDMDRVFAALERTFAARQAPPISPVRDVPVQPQPHAAGTSPLSPSTAKVTPIATTPTSPTRIPDARMSAVPAVEKPLAPVKPPLTGTARAQRTMMTGVAVVVIVACLALLLSKGILFSHAGPGGTSGPKGCTKIGVLLPESDTSPRWEGKDHPLLDAAIKKALPGAMVDFTNANNSSDTQISQADAALTKGDCILVVAPVNATAEAAIVDKAKAQNVPVIAYDRLIQSDSLSFYVSFDNVAVGKLQGQYVADHYQRYVTKNGNNNLVMIDGSLNDNAAILFHNGAHSVLDPLISAKSLSLQYETYTPNWNNQTAQTEMEDALAKLSDQIAVAYVANDSMAGTVIAALKAHGLAGKVLVTGQDATVSGIQQILMGNQTMTIYKAIAKEAVTTASLVAALSKGTDTNSIATASTKLASGNSVPSVLETPIAVDKSNIASTVLADGYVTKADICQGVPVGTDGIC